MALFLSYKDVEKNAKKETMRFTQQSMSQWSNLYLWNNSEVSNDLPPVSDSFVTVHLVVGKYKTFIVSTNTHFTKDVGEYVGMKCRKTTDPIELRTLLECSPHGKTLFLEFIQIFPESARVRLNDEDGLRGDSL